MLLFLAGGDPGAVLLKVVVVKLVVLVVAEAVVDNLGQVLRHFDPGAKVASAIEAFMLLRPQWGLGDDEKFADFFVIKLITIAITVIPKIKSIST